MKLVLHGGFNKERGRAHDEFYEEILSGLKKARVLLVYFASESHRVEEKSTIDKMEFQKAADKLSLEITSEIASEENFLEQVGNADVIYVNGGRTTRLVETMSNFYGVDWKEIFTNKILAGESAGANMISMVGYSPSADKAIEGLGLLPIKLIPHYEEDFENKLSDIRDELDTVRLKEYDFKVFHE